MGIHPSKIPIIRELRALFLMDDHVCPWWFAYTFDNPVRYLLQPATRILAPYVQPGMTAMDVGCGMGYFSLAMARQVGPEGRVVSVDLQEQMLQRVRKRARRRDLLERITLHQCTPDNLGVRDRADFLLTFWMVHEVPEVDAFLSQLHDVIRAGGTWLLVEPRGHTSQTQFHALMERAMAAGFRLFDQPVIRFSYAAVLERLP